jgi:hypothetical protein
MNIGIYAKALLHIIVVILAALGAAVHNGPITPVTVAQLAILGIGAVGVYWFPLIDKKLSSALKVGAAAVTAALAAVVPFLMVGHITGEDLIVVILAALGAVGVGVIPNGVPVVTPVATK